MKAILGIGLLLCCSCGTRRTASEAHTEIRRQEAVYLREGAVTGRTRTDSLRQKLRRAHTYKITHLSPPDSIGRQWPLSIEEGSLVEDLATARLTTEDSVATLRRDTQTRQTLAAETSTTDKTNRNTLPFRAVLRGLLLIGVAAVAIRFWRTYRDR